MFINSEIYDENSVILNVSFKSDAVCNKFFFHFLIVKWKFLLLEEKNRKDKKFIYAVLEANTF